MPVNQINSPYENESFLMGKLDEENINPSMK